MDRHPQIIIEARLLQQQMGREMKQQRGLIKSSMSWFRTSIKKLFKRQDEPEQKTHLDHLYQKYELDSKTQKPSQPQPRQKPKPKHQILQTVLQRLRGIDSSTHQKYLTRRKKIKQYSQPHSPPHQRHNELTCPICMQFFISPVPTSCGHTFCARCIENALLFKSGCPVCRSYLRGQEMAPCLAVNAIVRMFVQKGDEEQVRSYEMRVEETREWEEKRRVNKEGLVVGDRIDVRDTEYIWCVGRILNVYRKSPEAAPTELLIHYLGWNKIYDEILEITSPRVAPFGFYTSRQDIPRYALNETQQNYYSYVVTGPPHPPVIDQQQSQERPQQPEVELDFRPHVNRIIDAINQRMSLRELLETMNGERALELGLGGGMRGLGLGLGLGQEEEEGEMERAMEGVGDGGMETEEVGWPQSIAEEEEEREAGRMESMTSENNGYSHKPQRGDSHSEDQEESQQYSQLYSHQFSQQPEQSVSQYPSEPQHSSEEQHPTPSQTYQPSYKQQSCPSHHTESQPQDCSYPSIQPQPQSSYQPHSQPPDSQPSHQQCPSYMHQQQPSQPSQHYSSQYPSHLHMYQQPSYQQQQQQSQPYESY